MHLLLQLQQACQLEPLYSCTLQAYRGRLCCMLYVDPALQCKSGSICSLSSHWQACNL